MSEAVLGGDISITSGAIQYGVPFNEAVSPFSVTVPRNCAEATIKDIGVVCVDSGYELHVGGNGGIKVRVTDLLCKVETEEQVLEYTGAFCQFYREDAHYLERTAPWIERVGLEKVKKAVVDDAAQRKALYDRFLISQQSAQIDPWKARADGAEAAEFTPIMIEA
jgi:nitrite reductase (NADH) large subunit